MKKRYSIPLVLLLLLVAAAVIAPWKIWLAREIQARLAAAGVPPVEFFIGAVGVDGITLENIRFARPPLGIDSVRMDYELFALLRGEVRHANIPSLTLVQPGVAAEMRDITIDFSAPRAGTWAVKELTVKSDVMELPVFSAAGNFTLVPEFHADGEIGDKAKAYSLLFSFRPSRLTVDQFHMPWKGGMVSTAAVNVPLAGGKTRIPLTLKNVPLESLLAIMAGEKAHATGTVSGTLPVVVDVATGVFDLEKGELKAGKSGVIRLAPEVIPGNNEQVAQVRELMQDFQYETLSISTGLDKSNKLSMLLSLYGHNPNVYNGREVKLNVQLSGDLLSLLTQSIMPMANPERWLERDEKNIP